MYPIRFFSLFLLLLLSGCTCEEPALPVDPSTFSEPFQVINITEGSLQTKGHIYINFNQELDQKYLNGKQSLTLMTDNAFYSGEFAASKNLLIIPPCAIVCKDSFNGCRVRFQLNGDRNSPFAIRSTKAQLLDGDNNGEGGGNFLFEVRVSGGCQLPKAPRLTNTWYERIKTGFSIGMYFSEAMDTSTMRLGQSVIIRRGAQEVMGTLTWPVANRFTWAIFTSSGPLPADCGTSTCRLTMQIKGDGQRPARSIFGVPFDGNQDGNAGGDLMMVMDL